MIAFGEPPSDGDAQLQLDDLRSTNVSNRCRSMSLVRFESHTSTAAQAA